MKKLIITACPALLLSPILSLILVLAPGLCRAEPAVLTGTFLQFSDRDLTRPDEYWSAMLDAFLELGIGTVAIQWSVIDPTPYGGETNDVHDYTNLAANIIAKAEDRGMDYMVGLEHDPGYWEKIKRPPELVEVYLKRLLLDSKTIAEKICNSTHMGSGFQGWYIPQEVDGMSWIGDGQRQVLSWYVRAVKKAMVKTTAPGPVYISGFTNARVDPDAYREFLVRLMTESGLDGFMLQDGIGVAKTDLHIMSVYYESAALAVKQVAGDTGIPRSLVPVVELFTQVDGQPINQKPFRAVPASFGRVREQLNLAGKFSDRIFGFTVGRYMLPGKELLNDYLDYLKNPAPTGQ